MMMVLVQAAFAASVSVSPGDDLAALTSSLNPTDIVIFQDGTYELENTLVVEAVGEEGEGQGVYLRAQEGATPILKSIGTGTVFELRNSAHVSIEGLTFVGNDTWEEEGGNGVTIRDSTDVTFQNNIIQNVRSTLLRIDGDGANYTIRNNLLEFSSDGSGIYVGCFDGACWLQESVIEQNLIRELISENDRFGIILENGCQDNRIQDNVIYNVTGHGIRVEDTQLGDPNWVERNALWNGENDALQIDGASRVRNNLVFEWGGYGIRSRPQEGDLEDVVISYNTIALTDDWAVRLEDWPNRQGMVFSSNVIANITGRGLDYDNELGEDELDETTYFTNNVVSGFVDGIDPALYPGWFTPGAGTADFEDVVSWDFYPVGQSDLVGNADPDGNAWVPEVDFNGVPRNGAAPTIGAYEWESGGGNPGWIPQEGFKDLDVASNNNTTQVGGGCCGNNNTDDPSQAALLLVPLLAFGLRRRRQDA
jgi:hypothetical protein